MDGKLDMGHARALLALVKSRQVELAHQIVARALSVREAERMVKAALTPSSTKKTPAETDGDTRRLEDSIAEKLGARVVIKANAKGRGSLTLHFHSLEELDGLLEKTKLK